MNPRTFPAINQRLVDDKGYITQAWRQLLVDLWNTISSGAGNLQVNSLGVGIEPTGVAGELRTTGAVGIGGGLTITAGGLTLTTGVVGNGITADNIQLSFSAGVGMAASGAAGRLDVAGETSTNSLAVGATSIFSGGVTMLGDLTVQNVTVNFSVGVGVAASGTAGQIDLTNAIALNGVVYTNP